MHKHKTRLMAVSGATLALIVAGTAAVSAHPGDRGQRGMDQGKGRIGAGAKMGARAMPGMQQRLGGMRGALDDFERRETTVQTADGVTARRVEQGVVDSASDTSLGFTLGNGEAVTVVIDEDTQAIAFDEVTIERGRRNRERLAPTEIELADIEAGTEIVVWSDSENGGEFVAQRIVIQPDLDEADEMAEDVEAAVETEAVEEAAPAEAATTDA